MNETNIIIGLIIWTILGITGSVLTGNLALKYGDLYFCDVIALLVMSGMGLLSVIIYFSMLFANTPIFKRKR